ncbi:MAG: Rnase Y domain-containing protein, partial [candidate division WOR-3 bacterium]
MTGIGLILAIGVPIVVGTFAAVFGYWVSKTASRKRLEQSEQEAARVLAAAQEQAAALRREAEAANRQEWERERLKFESETAATRRELAR